MELEQKLSFITIRCMLYFPYSYAIFRHVVTTAIRLSVACVIGMQVRQVAKTPLEYFVNGQLCLSSSEPISHSKVWHCVKPSPTHYFVMCLKKGPERCILCICEHKFHCFVHYCFLLFPSWLMATFRLIGLDLSVPGSVYCDYFTTVVVKNKEGHQLREFALMTWKERGNYGHVVRQGRDMPLG